MKKNKIQAVLPDAAIEKFEKQAKKQKRSESNLAMKYIMEGLARDTEKGEEK